MGVKYRYTTEVLSGGQLRPYGDTYYHTRVIFEINSPYGIDVDKRNTWQPNDYLKEGDVRAILPSLRCGFTDYVYYPSTDDSMDAYFKTRLDWLRETSPGVWEFHTTSKYND